MKQTFSLILLMCSFILNSQNIYDYEKEISNKDNYIFSEIDFQNTDENLRISGTLITPNSDFKKLVIIVPGSGKDSRHSHFLLAEKLLQNGISVYRFDERGIGKSEGQYSADATSLTNDLFFAIKNLRENEHFNSKKIGFLGHSLGGMASIGAYEKGANIDFLVQVATPVKKNGAAFIYQLKNGNKGINQLILGENLQEKTELIELIHATIKDNPDLNTDEIFKKLKKIAQKKGFNKKSYQLYIRPFLIDIIKKDYEETYKNIKIPVLYIAGSNDHFIDSIDEIQLLDSYNNKNIETVLMDGYYHYLTTFEPKKLNTSVYEMDTAAFIKIINWILAE